MSLSYIPDYSIPSKLLLNLPEISPQKNRGTCLFCRVEIIRKREQGGVINVQILISFWKTYLIYNLDYGSYSAIIYMYIYI